jgi:hypothetical protein
VALGIALVLTLSTCTGCPKKEKGVKIEGGGVSQVNKEQETIQWGVDNTIRLLTNGPSGDAGKRLMAAKRAGRMVSKPELTTDLKQKLIDALNQMIMNEPMSEADDATKNEIVEEGKKSLQALKGG